MSSEVANPNGLAHWSGEAGEHWAAEADRYDRMNRVFADRIVEAAAPQPGERFLDVGCGNGALALAVAPAIVPGGRIVGLDLSRQMLEVARSRTAGLGDAVELRHGDAQDEPLARGGFDAVISRFGVMFFDDPAAAFANFADALGPGGRLVFTCWQDMAENDWVMVPTVAALDHVPVPTALPTTAAHGAFSLADPEATIDLLTAAGFADATATAVEAPMWMGASLDDAVAFMKTTEFAATLFAGVDAAAAEAGWDAVTGALADHVTADGVELSGAAWLVTATTAIP
jgi:SAM-dependent methyltransferase